MSYSYITSSRPHDNAPHVKMVIKIKQQQQQLSYFIIDGKTHKNGINIYTVNKDWQRQTKKGRKKGRKKSMAKIEIL